MNCIKVTTPNTNQTPPFILLVAAANDTIAAISTAIDK